MLERRAQLLRDIRQFFAERDVLEVETPLLARSATSDPHLESVPCQPDGAEVCFLPTSPESGMKRLLAASCGPIFQICKAFRRAEVGRFHQPEFTLLEWYRPGFSLAELRREIDELVRSVAPELQLRETQVLTYADLWQEHLGCDPHRATTDELRQLLTSRSRGAEEQLARDLERDDLLGLLMAEQIEARLPTASPVFVHDFPASQASMARIHTDDAGREVAARCELYIGGLEIANAYCELTDAQEQRQRFEADLEKRQSLNRAVPLDEELLAALQHGLPECSGVALGIDRLLMLLCGAQHIEEVLAFGFRRS